VALCSLPLDTSGENGFSHNENPKLLLGVHSALPQHVVCKALSKYSQGLASEGLATCVWLVLMGFGFVAYIRESFLTGQVYLSLR
jgi:hypothetical protein